MPGNLLPVWRPYGPGIREVVVGIFPHGREQISIQISHIDVAGTGEQSPLCYYGQTPAVRVDIGYDSDEQPGRRL